MMTLKTLFAITITVSAQIQSGRCPDDSWILLEDPGIKCYKKLRRELKFEESHRACVDEQQTNKIPHVAIPTNSRENQFLVSMINARSKSVWIGAKRNGQRLESVSNGKVLTFNRMTFKMNRALKKAIRTGDVYGRYPYLDRKSEWKFFKRQFDEKVKRQVICEVNARRCRPDAIEYAERTVVGIPCMRWNETSPHIPKNFPQNPKLAGNRCYPLNDDVPWCYTTDPNTRFGYCSPPRCAEDGINFPRDIIENDLEQILKAERSCGISRCQERIIGAAVSKPCVHPWMAQIAYTKEQQFADRTVGQHACGASIIGSCWIVTAAHCLLIGEDRPNPKVIQNALADNTFQVRSGRLLKEGPEEGSQTLPVKDIFVHPHFRVIKETGAADNDIALIQLKADPTGTCFHFNLQTAPICLPRAVDSLRTRDSCYITGWGRTSNDHRATFSDVIQRAQVPLTKFSECRTAYGNSSISSGQVRLTRQQHLCAAELGKIDACVGDSGGPLDCYDRRVRRQTLAGVVSFGKKCADEKYPGVYTNVAAYRQWIHGVITNPQPSVLRHFPPSN